MTFHCPYFLTKNMLSVRNVRFIKLPNVRTLGTMGVIHMRKRYSLIYLRGCLYTKFHPGTKSSLFLVKFLFCLHVFVEMKFHPGMRKRKKTCKHFINFKMSMFCFYFWRMYSNMFSKVTGALSGLRQFLAIGSPFKIMKTAFYFTSKTLVVLKIFKFLI